MRQVAQNYRNGELSLLEVPAPAARPGGVVVRTECSLISAGTERMKVAESKLSLAGKAKARPDQVRKVLESAAQQGVVATYRKAMNRLDSYTPLGYSLAGVVVEVGEGADEFRVGQRVACAGDQYAHHAEFNWVPTNLCVAVPDGVAPEAAAFATVGSIALHGFRRSGAVLGETAVVIGLGLVGQLLVQILRSAGVRVVGVDVSAERCDLAVKMGATAAAAPGSAEFEALRQSLAQPHRWGRGRPRFPGRRDEGARSDRAGSRTCPRPGHRRRHRQDKPRSALEQLLRQGARGQVVPLVRAGALRPEL